MKAPRWLDSARVTLATTVALAVFTLGAARHGHPRKKGVDDDFNPSEEQRVVEPGDTLWSICDQITGKPWVWPRVWAMNPEITNPHWVYPGDIIRFVPPTEMPPSRADLVASNIDMAEDGIGNASEEEADKARQGPKVEVINTSPPPTAHKRETLQRVFAGSLVTAKELASAGRISNAVPDKMLLGPRDLVYVTAPKDQQPKVGDRYLVYRTTRVIEHPVTNKPFGYMTEITGTLTIRGIEPEVARATLDATLREVERGQFLMPMSRALSLTARAIPAKASVDGVVVAIEGDGVSVGEQKLVFVDRGTNDGLEAGTELKVRTQSDPFTRETQNIPPVDVATLVVMDAKETTSTCLVVEAQVEVGPGDVVHAAPPSGAPTPSTAP